MKKYDIENFEMTYQGVPLFVSARFIWQEKAVDHVARIGAGGVSGRDVFARVPVDIWEGEAFIDDTEAKHPFTKDLTKAVIDAYLDAR